MQITLSTSCSLFVSHTAAQQWTRHDMTFCRRRWDCQCPTWRCWRCWWCWWSHTGWWSWWYIISPRALLRLLPLTHIRLAISYINFYLYLEIKRHGMRNLARTHTVHAMFALVVFCEWVSCVKGSRYGICHFLLLPFYSKRKNSNSVNTDTRHTIKLHIRGTRSTARRTRTPLCSNIHTG